MHCDLLYLLDKPVLRMQIRTKEDCTFCCSFHFKTKLPRIAETHGYSAINAVSHVLTA